MPRNLCKLHHKVRKKHFCFSFKPFKKKKKHQSVCEKYTRALLFESLRQETKILFEKSELNFLSFTWSPLCSGKMNLDLSTMYLIRAGNVFCLTTQFLRFLLNRPHWADSVIESSCLSVCVSVCLCVCVSLTIQKTLFRRLWRPLVKWYINIYGDLGGEGGGAGHIEGKWWGPT